jgi:hypothetical protein
MRALISGLTTLAVVSLVLLPPMAYAGKGRNKRNKAKVTAQKASVGTLTILSTNIGAKLEIDGKAVGVLVQRQPKLKLNPGQHTIRVSMPGWTEFLDTFVIHTGEDTLLEVDLVAVSGILTVKTAKPGATVKINGKLLGVTPFKRSIKAGNVVIEISRPGYKTVTKQMKLKAGSAYPLSIVMAPFAVVSVKSKSFYQTWWFWTVVGVVLAGTATATAVAATGENPSAPSADFSLYIP